MEPENNVGLGGCWIMECLLPYFCMVTVPVGLVRFHCTTTLQTAKMWLFEVTDTF